MLKHKPRQIYYKHVHIKIDILFPRYSKKSKGIVISVWLNTASFSKYYNQRTIKICFSFLDWNMRTGCISIVENHVTHSGMWKWIQFVRFISILWHVYYNRLLTDKRLFLAFLTGSNMWFNSRHCI